MHIFFYKYMNCILNILGLAYRKLYKIKNVENQNFAKF